MSRLLLALLATVLTVLPALATATTAAAAGRGPCLDDGSGPTCRFWTGKVTFVADGDTIDVDIDGDGTRAARTVRFTGINAMELTRYSKYPARRRGACHGLEATAVVERYVKRSRGVVRLAAQNPRSTTGKRLRRSVAVRVGGRWVDLGRILMKGGHALWLPNPVEHAHNLEYHALAEQAAAAGRNLYNPSLCGAGPSPEAQLKLSVHWDADGADGADLNGEWVDIRNTGATDVSLAGWWLRDSWLIYNARRVPGYEFPADAVVPAHGSLRLYVGCGSSSPQRHFWCQDSAVFENADFQRHSGDGGYLFDPQGDLRASSIYPCVFRCEDPLLGAVQLSVQPKSPESITVTNVSASTVDLSGYLVKLHLGGAPDKFIFGYPLESGTRLAPGERITLWMQRAPEGAGGLVRSLGRAAYVLADGGNTVSLRSATDVQIACAAWGSARCRAR
jgi:endonuclease YncB( thermonuclease family)